MVSGTCVQPWRLLIESMRLRLFYQLNLSKIYYEKANNHPEMNVFHDKASRGSCIIAFDFMMKLLIVLRYFDALVTFTCCF